MKRVYAFILAFALIFALNCTAGAAYAQKALDLTDWSSVRHKNAVSQMVDLGIINGMPDGSFCPAGNIDRASWAKMVYIAATGSNDADAYLGTATGLRDIFGTWAESYISYLKAHGYVSGDNEGNYKPSNNVTVAEACKMMLTILGYDPIDRGYQNDSAWASNIMADAKRYGLLINVDPNMTTFTPLTRDNAAEIVWNALNADVVVASGWGYDSTGYALGQYAFGLDGSAGGNAVPAPSATPTPKPEPEPCYAKVGTYQTYLDEDWSGTLEIKEVTSKSIYFDIGWYRMGGFSARATLEGNTATFNRIYYGEEGEFPETASGSLMFHADGTVDWNLETDIYVAENSSHFRYYTEEELAQESADYDEDVLLMNSDDAVWINQDSVCTIDIRFFENGTVRYLIWDVDTPHLYEGTYSVKPEKVNGDWTTMITIDGVKYKLSAYRAGGADMWLTAVNADPKELAGHYELLDGHGYYDVLARGYI